MMKAECKECKVVVWVDVPEYRISADDLNIFINRQLSRHLVIKHPHKIFELFEVIED